MSNPLGELSNEISFEERKAQQEETEKAQTERYRQDQVTAICKSEDEEHIFGSQFTYSDYLFDGNSNSTSADLQPGPSSTGDQPGPSHSQSVPAASLLPLAPNSSVANLNFSLSHSDQQQARLPHFSSHQPQSVTDYIPEGGAIVNARASLSSNEYMLFESSMLDTTTTDDLSAMQETSSTPTVATKVVEYFTSPPPLQSALPQDSPNVGSMSQQLSLEANHRVQSQQQAPMQQENTNFRHFHRMNGNGAAGGVILSEVPNDTNNNPVAEDLKENISGMLNENTPLANANSVPTTSGDMDSSGHSNHVNQYITSNAGQLVESTNSTNKMDSNGQRQNMMAQELGVHQQQQTHNIQTVPTSATNEGHPNLLTIIQNNYTCYSDESQMQQHGFSDSNESALVSQQQTTGQDSQLLSTDSSRYHSHHLPPMQQPQQPQTPAANQQQSNTQHHRPMGSQQMNHHGQTIPHQQQPHLSQQQHHPMVSNAPSTPSMEYSQPQLMSNSSPSIDAMSSNSNTTLQQQQQQSSQSTNPNSANAVSIDTMLSPKTSTPQSTTVSTNAEIKSDGGNYATSSASDYMIQSTPGQSGQYHQSIHHAEVSMCSAPSSTSASPSLTSSNAPQQALPNTAHQRTHYLPSNENIHTSAPSNSVNQLAGANVNSQANGTGSVSTEPSNTTVGSGTSQILKRFETIDSAPSGPSVSIGQQPQQQSCFVYVKCDPTTQTTHIYPDDSKNHSNVQQMQFEVSQPRLSLNDQNASSSHHSSGDNSLQVQQVQPPQQQQPQLLNLVTHQQQQQSSPQVCDDGQSQQQVRPPSNAGVFSVPSNSQNSQICISRASNVPASGLQSPQVPTVTLTGLPALHPSSQAQVNNVTTFSPLPPKKIRYATNVSALGPGNSSLGQSQQPTALLFASKSSVTPSVPPLPQVSHQPPPPQSSSALNPNVVQTMILPSNIASFNQAQSIQSQIQQQNVVNLQVANSPTSVPSLQNVTAKHFVPNSGNTERSYSTADIILQTRQFPPTSSMPSSSVSVSGAPSYPTSGVSSSIQSRSQYSRVQHVGSTAAASVVSSQGQIFFNSSVPNASNIRFLEPNMNYSIVALQPATIQQGRQQQQQQQSTQATKSQTVTQKILLHSVPVSDHSEPNDNTPLGPAATALISLNPKFALNANPSQMATLGHLPALNNSPSASSVANQQLPTGSIIFSSLPLPGANNIPGSQASRSVTNFAVPIPVVTSAIVEPRSQNLTITSIHQASVGQFAHTAFAPTTSQPTILSNLLPNVGANVPALATKSTKMPSILKSASKSGNSSVSGSKSGNASTSPSTSGKNINPPPLMSDDPAKPFKCCLCGKNLASKNVYQLHLRSHSGEKPFSCQLCNNRFSQKTSLTRHMRSHTGERPFPCQVCNKRFADKERIKIHMRIHTGEKPFSCVVCGKKFSQKSTVKRHMSVHTGVKPFKCDVCGKGFANRGNLTAHTKTHQSQQSQANQQQARSSSLSTSMAVSNHPQQNVQVPHHISIELQSQMTPPNSGAHASNIVFTSSTGANNVSVVTNNGVRVEIANIKTEVDDVSCDGKNSNPHNHQFTSATMPPAHGPQSQGQQQQPAPLSS